MNEDGYKYIVVAVGIIVVGCVLVMALHNGIDGAILGAGLTVIGTIIGYMFAISKTKATVGGTRNNTSMKPLTRLSSIVSSYHGDWYNCYLYTAKE